MATAVAVTATATASAACTDNGSQPSAPSASQQLLTATQSWFDNGVTDWLNAIQSDVQQINTATSGHDFPVFIYCESLYSEAQRGWQLPDPPESAPTEAWRGLVSDYAMAGKACSRHDFVPPTAQQVGEAAQDINDASKQLDLLRNYLRSLREAAGQ